MSRVDFGRCRRAETSSVGVWLRTACEVPAECVHRKNDGVLFLLRSGCDGAPAGRGASGEQECNGIQAYRFISGCFVCVKIQKRPL